MLDQPCGSERSSGKSFGQNGQASSMQIVHLTSVHEPFDDRIFYKECHSLAQAGSEVTLVVPHARDEVVDGVRLKAVPAPRGRLTRMTRTVRQVYREALRQRAEVYHF